MSTPATEPVDTRCATCRETTLHNVLKGKLIKGGRGVEGTFECSVCQTVHQGLVRFPDPVSIPVMVSVGARSYPARVEVLDDDQIAVGDEFEIDEDLIEVTSVELKELARRVRRAKAPDIHTIWAKSIKEITVGFSLNIGDITKSFETVFGPEDEISVGDEFDLEEQPVVVDRILTLEGKRYRGTYNVRQIKRVWLRNKRRVRPEPMREGLPTRGPGSNAPRKVKNKPFKGGRPSGARPSGGRPSGARPDARGPPRGPRSDDRGPPRSRPSGGGRGAPRAPRSDDRGPPRSRPSGGGRGPPRSRPGGGGGGRGPPRSRSGGGGGGRGGGRSGSGGRGPPRGGPGRGRPRR